MKSILFPKEAFVNPKLSEYFCQILLEQSLVAKFKLGNTKSLFKGVFRILLSNMTQKESDDIFFILTFSQNFFILGTYCFH